jgi:uncharacterized protein YbdZ (MbtH family)
VNRTACSTIVDAPLPVPDQEGAPVTEDPDQDRTVYQVVLNHEEQYSIWPVDRELPNGWRAEGTTGSRDEVLAHIDEVWTDMRPLSLRKAMEEAAARPPAEEPAVAEPEEETLVARLSRGEHPVEVVLRPEHSAEALREAVDRGYVFVKFTGTRGGTELGIRLDRDACDLDALGAGTGRITLVGDLTLDFEPVRCTANVNLETLTGTGHLTVRESTA